MNIEYKANPDPKQVETLKQRAE
ncbi:hypothetical protein CRENPOLYSF2_2770011 [Crenothrix polyspora]|uniref:Uncharacterized protein n=1 Tax=Crenothrix polyspora TaxID=360316 RepID=A0A1R4H8S3_9GAMM|nr:hypothetical protein CRENPOLYSF2_2770011 [Crenothrix polyspora]